jgi:hypothetical protein
MNTPRFPAPPNFDVVLERLKSLLDTISEAAQEGTLHVREYCKWQAESIDFALAPNLVRHKAKQILISSGQDAKDEEEESKIGFDTEQIPNNGIFIKVPGFHIRVLKSPDDGSIPPPGLSLARQNFYKQFQAVIDFEEFRNGNDHVQPTWSLVVHWSVDEHYNLLRLSLALPLDVTKADNGKLTVECHFNEPFWTKPLPKITVINEQPPVTNLDVPGIQIEEKTDEKTGEDPKGE